MNQNDSSIVASLYLAEAAQMRAFTRRRIRDPDEADDLVSEAFRIISEREDLREIRNPAAFLMTVLHRQINSHLRKQYRRKQLPIEAAEHDIPASPDIAESYEKEERAALVAQSLQEIRSPRQQRALNLYSLNYKAGEIAQIETAAGKPTTSHQVSCVLQGGFANLKTQFRRRGLVPTFIPAAWIIRFRSRITNAGQYVSDHIRSLDSVIALQIFAVVSVATIFSPSSDKPAIPPTVDTIQTSRGQTEFDLAIHSAPDSRPSALDVSAILASSDPASRLSPSQGHSLPQEPLLTPVTRTDEEPTVKLPVGTQAPPRAAVSREEDRSEVTIEPTPRRSIEVSSDFPQPRAIAAPSLQDQTVELVQEPSRVPTPECGGLPPICDDGPPPESP